MTWNANMDEAPRDGTEILGYDAKTKVMHVTCWDYGWNDPDSHYYSQAPEFKPTHWQPLPSPPETKHDT